MADQNGKSSAFLFDVAPNEALAEFAANERDNAKLWKKQSEYILSLQSEVAALKKQIQEKDERIRQMKGGFGIDNHHNQAFEASGVPDTIGPFPTETDNESATAKLATIQQPPTADATKAEATESRFTDVEVWKFFFKFAGFNRFSLLSDEWHDANPTAANQLFGFKTWAEAKATVKSMFPTMQLTPPHIYKLVSTGNGDALDLDLRECSRFEQLMAVRLMDRTGLTVKRAALLYNKNARTVTRWKGLWSTHWGSPSGDNDDEGENVDDERSSERSQTSHKRPFQSRQMINPVKPAKRNNKKSPAPEEQPNNPVANQTKKVPQDVMPATAVAATPALAQFLATKTTTTNTNDPATNIMDPSAPKDGGDMWYQRNFGQATL
mmetsp:Transcript_4170/g.11352  ORF Transcript_4170/g.11352 Transcript_4170/m.11352 type:complete len:380 (-) Transcript_4170:236-1375(-)